MPSTTTTVAKTRVLNVGIGGEPPFQVSTTLHFLSSRVRAWTSLTGHWPKDEDAPFPLNGGSLIVAYLLPSFDGGDGFAEGDKVTGVTFILTGGIAAGIGTVEGVRVLTLQPVAAPVPAPTPSGVVIYDAADGHILHAHSAITLAGGQAPRPDDVEAEAFALARRVGTLPPRAAAIPVSADALDAGGVHRVDPTSRQLIRVRSVEARDRGRRAG